MLRGFRLLFLSHDGNEGDECEAKVGGSDAELELAKCLEKDGGFNVSDCASYFDETNVGYSMISSIAAAAVGIGRGGVGLFVALGMRLPVAIALIVHWNVCDFFDPALDLVGNVRYNLYRLSEVVSATFFGDDLAVYFAGGDVVVGGEGDGEEAFVVAEVEVGFAAVVEDEALHIL